MIRISTQHHGRWCYRGLFGHHHYPHHSQQQQTTSIRRIVVLLRQVRGWSTTSTTTTTTTTANLRRSDGSRRSMHLAVVERGDHLRRQNQQQQRLRCPSSSSSSSNRYLSSLDTPEDPAAAEALRRKMGKSNAAKTVSSPPKAIFPWRHETSDVPLPRFVAGTDESLFDAQLPLPGQAFIANMFLNVPFWQVFASGIYDWRGDMAEDFAYAFSAGVAGVVSNVYKIPYNKILDDEDVEVSKVEFNYPPTLVAAKQPDESPADDGGESLSGKDEEGGDNAAGGNNDVSEKDDDDDEQKKQKDKEKEGDGDDDSLCTNADMMLDRPLMNLYKSAHENGRHQLQIKLQMEPKRCMMRSIFCIPFLTRIQAETNPQILNRMIKTMALIRSDFNTGFNELYSYLSEQLETKGERLETTIEVEILVEADEIFQVIDKDTGTVLQGSDGGGNVRRVMHVVKFENTVTTSFSDNFPYWPSTKLGNWIITDIDDLLGPKKWYHRGTSGTDNNTSST